MTPWLILTATLPTRPSGLRVRIWRTLKSTHCASLREGVYLLPAAAASAKAFWEMDAAIRQAGADAHQLELQARDAAQENDFRARFDRSELYAEFALSLKEARKAFKAAAEAEIRKTLRSLEGQLQGILESDFFPRQCSPSGKLYVIQDGFSAEVHYGIGVPFWSQCYASEAVNWLLSHDAVQSGWTAVDCEKTNTRRVLKKAGFEQDGVLANWSILPAFSEKTALDAIRFHRLRS
jgi:RimJ/RimL family protein N-acetyltransferase